MKNKRKIWKIIGGLAGIATIACIIPACVVSCGSSSTSDTNSNANSSSSSSTSTTNNPNPKTNDVGLIATNVNGAATLQTINSNQTGNYSSSDLLFNYQEDLTFPWVSCYYLNETNSKYTISLSTDSNVYTYQWYQVPVTSLYNVFGSEIVKSTLSIYNSQSTLPVKASGINFMIALAKQSNAIANATSSTYQFNYGAMLNDAIYFCKINNGNNTFYSEVTWLQQKDPTNTLGNTTYGINELVNNGQSITTIESTGKDTYISSTVIPNNTKIDFNLSMLNGNNEPLSYQDFNDTNPYYILYNFNWNGGYYSNTIEGVNPAPVYLATNLSNMDAWNQSITWNTSYADMEAGILNQNGQILNLDSISNSNNNEFEVGVKNYDPLKIANTKCTVNTSLKATTNSDTQEVYNVKANSQLTFTLKINNFDVSDFTNTDYYITWSLQSDETESSSVYNQTEIIKMLPLSNENAWAFTITVPAGKYYFNVGVYNGLYPLYQNPNAIINASN